MGLLGCCMAGSSGGDDALGKNGGDGHVQVRRLQFGFNGLLEQIADFALGCGVADIERKSGNLAGSALRSAEGQRRPGARCHG